MGELDGRRGGVGPGAATRPEAGRQRDEGRAEEFMQKAQAVCERAGLESDALAVLPFLD